MRNGQLKATGKYVAGKLDGHWEWRRENGQRLQAGVFNNGVKKLEEGSLEGGEAGSLEEESLEEERSTRSPTS